MMPLSISSLNSCFEISLVKPKGFSTVSACFTVPPINDGTVTFAPGPINVHQPPMPTATASSGIKRRTLLFGRIGAFTSPLFSRAISRVISLVGSLSIGSIFLLLTGLGGCLRIGRSNSRLICCRDGSNLIWILRSAFAKAVASLGRSSGFLLVAAKINSSSSFGIFRSLPLITLLTLGISSFTCI